MILNVRKSLTALIMFMALSSTIFSQIDITPGTWRTHFYYESGDLVLNAGDRVYCVASGNLFYYHKIDGVVKPVTKVDGLSDMFISALAYNASSQQLIIGYSNGNMDIMQNGVVKNFPQITEKLELAYKKINNINIFNNKAYLSTGFGIVAFNLQTLEFNDTYYLGTNGTQVEIRDFCESNEKFYAVTANKIFEADANDPNLINFSRWKAMENYPLNGKEIIQIEALHGILFTILGKPSADNSLIYFKNGVWQSWVSEPPNRFVSLNSVENALIVIDSWKVRAYDENLNLIKGTVSENPANATLDENMVFYIADRYSSLLKNNGQTSESIFPNGVSGEYSFRLASTPNNLYVTRGGINVGWNNIFQKGGYYLYRNQEWKGIVIDEVGDALKILPDPANENHIFVSTWTRGVVEMLNGKVVKIYDNKNGSLPVVTIMDAVRAYGMDFDREGNLFVTTSNAATQVSMKKVDGTWVSWDFSNAMGYDFIGDIHVTRSGDKWIVLPRGNGMFAFNENGTPDNKSDDIYRKFSIKDIENVAISDAIYCITEDRDGNIWMGTNAGPVIYYNPQGVFTNQNFYASRIDIPRAPDENGIVFIDYLLETEAVTAIAIDGGNRKWLGTANSGVYLMSEDGRKEIHHFTDKNSPLPSDNIYDISINEKTGEVFFATQNGLVSFRSQATKGLESFGKVYAYPNPVREDYFGDVIITGLMEKTNVKITDISGNIVNEINSLGGQAVWNGKTFSGNRVKTGVYLVFCSNEDGSQTAVTKLLFIH